MAAEVVAGAPVEVAAVMAASSTSSSSAAAAVMVEITGIQETIFLNPMYQASMAAVVVILVAVAVAVAVVVQAAMVHWLTEQMMIPIV